MKALFYLLSGLLGLSGILHLVKVFANPMTPARC